MSLGLVTRFKNERHIMFEWVNHHLEEGIDKIYLIDHKSNDNFLVENNWLYELINEGKVMILKSKTDNQKKDYDEFLDILKENKWIIQLDIDEFIYTPQKNRNLKDILENELKNIDYFEVKWKLFSHRTELQPKSIISNNIFTHNEGTDPTSPITFKCLAKTEYLKSINIHFMEFERKVRKMRLKNCHNNFININHYRTQSDEYLFGVKEQRGGGVNKIKYKKRIHATFEQHKSFSKECLILKEKRKDLIDKCNEKEQIKPQIYKNSSWYKRKIKNINKNNENNSINTL